MSVIWIGWGGTVHRACVRQEYMCKVVFLLVVNGVFLAITLWTDPSWLAASCWLAMAGFGSLELLYFR